jgi:hypothetical protein
MVLADAGVSLTDIDVLDQLPAIAIPSLASTSSNSLAAPSIVVCPLASVETTTVSSTVHAPHSSAAAFDAAAAASSTLDASLIAPFLVPDPLNPHELAMQVFEQVVAPFVLAMPGANAGVRLLLYRGAYSRSMYACLSRVPNPTLAQLEQFIHNLLVSLGLAGWLASLRA